MSLYVGRHVIGMNKNPDNLSWDAASPDQESHVEFEIVALSSTFQTRDENGEFAHTEQLVLLRKVR